MYLMENSFEYKDQLVILILFMVFYQPAFQAIFQG